MTTYLISDLHLQASHPELTTGFYRFVEQTATDATELYILGDFFDAWIGDDEDDCFYLGVIAKLKNYTDKGLRIFFMHGNRDFLVGSTFAEHTGITLLNDPTDITLAGKNVRLMHGDSLCTADTGYMQFRAQVRSPQWQQQVLSLPLEQRRLMAAQMRSQSQSMNSNKAEDIMDVNPADVAAQFNENDAKNNLESKLKNDPENNVENKQASAIDILLHGHTHRPARHQVGVDGKERIVLGDWGKTMWYVRADQNTIELIQHKI